MLLISPLIVPIENAVVDYDRRNLVTYARLIDAVARGHDWRNAAHIVLGCDVEADEAAAEHCWRLHVERALRLDAAGLPIIPAQILEAADGALDL